MWEGPNVGAASAPRFVNSSKPHSKDLRLHRVLDSPATFFLTKSLHPKKPVLDEGSRDLIVNALSFSERQGRIYLGAFVVMPDHWHALVGTRDGWTVSRFMHSLMSFVGAKTKGLLNARNTGWQEGYYDTQVKTAKQFSCVSNYIESNPVAKKLVVKAQEWQAGSAARPHLKSNPWPWMFPS